jgi:hypothetical protein
MVPRSLVCSGGSALISKLRCDGGDRELFLIALLNALPISIDQFRAGVLKVG